MSGSEKINQRMGVIEWALLIGLSVLWGGSFYFVGVAVDGLPPLTIVVLRVGIAALALNVAVLAMGLHLPSDRRADEIERPTPENRQADQQGPFDHAHSLVDLFASTHGTIPIVRCHRIPW